MDWKLYPENLPEVDGKYLVTFAGDVEVAYYENRGKQYDENGVIFYGPLWKDVDFTNLYDVVAFAEKPQPYKEVDNGVGV